MGKLYLDMADWQKATDLYREALPLAQAAGDARRQGLILHSLGVANWLTNPEGAIDYFQQALPIRRSAADRAGEAQTLSELAGQYNAMGRLPEAIRYAGDALALQRTLNDRRGQARALRTLGLARAKLGETAEAAKQLDEALTINRSLQDRRSESLALYAMGFTHARAGQTKLARDAYHQAAAIAEQLGDSDTLANALRGSARANRDLGDLAAARSDTERALELVEKVRSNVGGDEARSSYFSSTLETFELYIDVLMSQKDSAAALAASERSRARSLLEMLAASGRDIREGVDPELVEREREVANLLNAKGTRLLPLMGRDTPLASALKQEVRALENQQQEILQAIRKASPRYAALTQPEPLTLKQIQEQVLDADSLLLEYSLGEKRSYLWAVTRDAIHAFELPARDRIESQVSEVATLLTARSATPRMESDADRLRRIAQADAKLPAAARQLSDMLLAPAAAVLAGKRLVVVPDGALQRVPFAMLPLPGRAEPLVTAHEIVMLPSASALAVLRTEIAGRKPAPKLLAVFADPVFDLSDPRVGAAPSATPAAPTSADSTRLLQHIAGDNGVATATLKIPRLPFTALEADQILSIGRDPSNLRAVGLQATRAAASGEQLSQYRYLHFATHGYLDTERPSLSALLLSQVDAQRQPQDGFLRVTDIYNSRLSADLVVLSACQTGLGKEVRGEGLMGLTRAFLYAGAPRVVVSLWNVNDRATADLMTTLYRAMLQKGRTPAAALREAQLSLRSHKSYQSPYFWAAFVQHGEWK
jgi:CHAT domain-containing protein